MENLEVKEEKNKKQKTGIKTGRTGEIGEQEQYRVVLNKEANAMLEEFLAKVNFDFKGGKATRSDVANYVFTKLKNLLNDIDVKALQMDCFDDKEALVSLGKSNDDLPENVKQAIREAYGLIQKEKKKSAKVNSDLSTGTAVDK